MSTFALVVSTGPTDNKTVSALNFARTLLTMGHQVNGIFFYQDGVLNANTFVQTPSDETNLTKEWQLFNQQTATPLHLCISAAERRGLTDSNDEDFYHNIVAEFTISGLGELAVLTAKADKVVQL
ncbi:MULTISPECIES: sulfurtransferase complex subunit TusD [unclassified Thalassotalea]|uniref:sulfurtransferase complex subunit TusD n=1 Tax=unclassified Thalassotalea TaxID=2614972 RepID=UPI00145EEED8|nr:MULTISPECIES: sulfurtransferase complex subunit TusD [unclassified Thalassotalea]NMP15375.1 sulfurtransferase complex subunit TusD [Thalassotalea sp. Y01]